jgi:zinc/manganese transport system permease protein
MATAPHSNLTPMPSDAANPQLSWDLARDLGAVLEYHFMLNALLAGSIVAVMAGLVGWLMVLRRQAFAGHTLSMMAFPGASGAALLGVGAAWGYFAFCGAGALLIGVLAGGGRRSWRAQGPSIAAVQASALALGFLFVSLYGGVLGDLESLLFGNVLAISDAQLLVLVAVAVAVGLVLAGLARPLLFASVDPELAGARGVPVRALSSGFLLLLGLAVAATSQVTGPLLVFALLVMPAATAQLITARPAVSLALTVAVGLLTVWLGMGIAYFSVYPAGFFITSIGFAFYLLARAGAALARRRAGSPTASPAPRRAATGAIA